MKKLLIANRGEIARRVIRTAHRMGIATVAVHSEADAAAPFVREAGQAVALAGPRPYLDGAAIIVAARATGADAIHPGYGFLSENADFARDVRAAGLIFVGPPEAAMRVMALKDSAKTAMQAAGVATTPGYQGDDQSAETLAAEAARIGFPLLIKAVAGGGGKGMRGVQAPQDFAEALAAAQREGETAFGNPAVLLEKLILRPRHVEVQVFGDAHGGAVHLHERDCSLQRRHQKVIEEAPAPGLSPALRAAMGAAAVRAAQAIGYTGAGTIEFIVDLDVVDAAGDPAFYFMEMNTRLQVEHPVTEAITGLDLVEWQLRIARGEPLPLAQSAIAACGHAVEARLYAEDPDTGFLPATGTLERLAFGSGEGIRIDTGVETGSRIGLDYDPMIAKVIASGATRDEAITRLVAALDATVVDGLKSNRAFLARLADHAAFRAGDVDTGFIARHMADLSPPAEAPPQVLLLAALGLALPAEPVSADAPIFARSAFRLNLPATRHLRLWQGDRATSIDLVPAGASRWQVIGLPGISAVAASRTGDAITADIDGGLITGTVLVTAHAIEVRHAGQTFTLARHALRAAVAAGGDGRVKAPMPGRVLAVDVAPGQAVVAGDRLLVLEAMKMEHRLVAPKDGSISAVHIATGDQVADGMCLVEIA